MPRSRTKRGRVYQVANYLRDGANFSPGYPVSIRFVKMSKLPKRERKLFGYAEKEDGKPGLIVMVDTRASTTSLLIDTYIHELCHHLDGSWTSDRPHGPNFGRLYAKVLTNLFDIEPSGIKRSCEFPDTYRTRE